MIKTTTMTAAMLALLTFTASAAEKPKQIFAHYMGCFPAGTGAMSHFWRTTKLDHRSADPRARIGGGMVNWPLVPPGTDTNRKKGVELDIKRAIRAGFDGFALDAYAGDVGARGVLNTMFKICEEQKLPFQITICLDPSCLPKHPDDKPGEPRVNAYAEAIQFMLRENGKSPNLMRRDGKLMVFGYCSSGIMGRPFDKAELPKLAAAYREVEKKVGQPIYFHFCANSMQAKGASREELYGWAAKNFPAVGAFFDGYYADGKIAEYGKIVKAAGAEWSQPMWFQYNNRGNNDVYGKPGFDKLRQMWKFARELDSTLLQFVTWNDYGEATNIAPCVNTNYAVMTLNRYFIKWWKTGREPQIREDEIIVDFHRYPRNANTFPFAVRQFKEGVLEVVTLLKAPAKIELPGRNLSYDAPAGLYVRQFPVTPGKVEVRAQRGGRTVAALKAPEEITDKPWRYDVSMYAYSTRCEKEWAADFPGVPFPAYSENGDADGDGLPNWFEMYYFGRFPDIRTQTAAKPGDDPDGDGKTNLQEYLAQTDPTFAEPPYAPGQVWNFRDVANTNRFSNPDIDGSNAPVWHYLYKLGQAGKIALDGTGFERTTGNHQNIPWAGKSVHVSRYNTPGFSRAMGLITQQKLADGTIRTQLKSDCNVNMLIGWQSPVNGTVSVRGKVQPNPGSAPISLHVLDAAGKTLADLPVSKKAGADLTLDNLPVQKGDMLYFAAKFAQTYYTGDKILLDGLEIKLDKLDNSK